MMIEAEITLAKSQRVEKEVPAKKPLPKTDEGYSSIKTFVKLLKEVSEAVFKDG